MTNENSRTLHMTHFPAFIICFVLYQPNKAQVGSKSRTRFTNSFMTYEAINKKNGNTFPFYQETWQEKGGKIHVTQSPLLVFGWGISMVPLLLRVKHWNLDFSLDIDSNLNALKNKIALVSRSLDQSSQFVLMVFQLTQP